MKTLEILNRGIETVPVATAWYLADIGEARGREDLFTAQSPQKLKALREHALVESAVSSNRIEGVTVNRNRVGTIVFGKPLLRDRAEEEVRGYRDALDLIDRSADSLGITAKTILILHRTIRNGSWDAGRYKEEDADIIERSPDGRVRVRFRPVAAEDTRRVLADTIRLHRRCLKTGDVHPLVVTAAVNLDFLCIHPFRDGNGRVSRLLLLLGLYRLGYGVGRYTSLERLIEENKERYYETLETSSRGWHEGEHNPWPYVNYLLFILKTAYSEFEERVGQVKSPRGAKTRMVRDAIRKEEGPFTLAELEQACPGVSRDMIRRVLREERKAGRVECRGRGPGAEWVKKG
jgi:Fic family protein